MKVAFDILCLDEHDSPNLSELNGKSRKEINSISNRRHFGLCGVIIPGATYPSINMEGRRIQERCHGKGKFIPFHYVDILHSRDKYSFLGKNSSKKQSLIALLNSYISSSKVKILGCFIDKQQLALRYGLFTGRKLTNITKI